MAREGFVVDFVVTAAGLELLVVEGGSTAKAIGFVLAVVALFDFTEILELVAMAKGF